MTDIMSMLVQMSPKQESSYTKALRPKQELLIMLLENEHARLTTWLFPIDSGRRGFTANHPFRPPADVSLLLSSS